MIVHCVGPNPPIGEDNWQIWVQLEEGDPLTSTESFIIGIGDTLDDAKADALKDLRAAIVRVEAL